MRLMRGMMMGVAAVLVGVAGAMVWGAEAGGGVEKVYSVPERGGVKLMIPEGWVDRSIAVPAGVQLPQVVALEGTDAKGKFDLKITPLVPSKGRAEILTDAGLKKLAETVGARYVPGSREKALNLKEVKGEGVHGYYFTVTDASADPGAYPCMTTVLVSLGDVVLTGTLMHQKDAPSVESTLAMMKKASVVAKGAAATGPAGKAALMRFASPGGKWDLVMDGAGMVAGAAGEKSGWEIGAGGGDGRQGDDAVGLYGAGGEGGDGGGGAGFLPGAAEEKSAGDEEYQDERRCGGGAAGVRDRGHWAGAYEPVPGARGRVGGCAPVEGSGGEEGPGVDGEDHEERQD